MSLSHVPLQETVEDAVCFSGRGVHGGAPCRVFVRPAPVDHGIVFRRIDLPGEPRIPARVEHVVSTTLATTLGVGEATVGTVEHLLSALLGLGIDNALIDVEGPELPILDGSAGPFTHELRGRGTAMLQAEKHVWIPIKPVRIEDGNRWIEIEPADELIIDYTLQYDHPVIGTQRVVYRHSPVNYERELSHARTFGLAAEVEMMRQQGLAIGGALDCAVVVGDDRVLNPEGLRYPDEFARHKILDIIGDLAMIGGPILGRITASRSGHSLNQRFVEALLDGGLVECSPLSEVRNVIDAQPTQRVEVLSA
ncbi:MAG: UDP-3-O-[3-hydroxymyristoyl] N-acetylglucosamine deacetylase [Candidatus Dadabacteria bacterium]|nr:MAG: UDP-3-O-[3-hydroxymyristoyl] N-acetylglucosamine deacetylase [Candidatus Dadabacteria bacterium]